MLHQSKGFSPAFVEGGAFFWPLLCAFGASMPFRGELMLHWLENTAEQGIAWPYCRHCSGVRAGLRSATHRMITQLFSLLPSSSTVAMVGLFAYLSQPSNNLCSMSSVTASTAKTNQCSNHQHATTSGASQNFSNPERMRKPEYESFVLLGGSLIRVFFLRSDSLN